MIVVGIGMIRKLNHCTSCEEALMATRFRPCQWNSSMNHTMWSVASVCLINRTTCSRYHTGLHET